MKVDVIRPAQPPVEKVIIELTPDEARQLLRLFSCVTIQRNMPNYNSGKILVVDLTSLCRDGEWQIKSLTDALYHQLLKGGV